MANRLEDVIKDDGFVVTNQPRNIKKPFGSAFTSEEKKSRKEVLKKSFQKLRFYGDEDKYLPIPPRCNLNPTEDYTEVFLSHARVYAFADKYDIQPLGRCALAQLHETLKIFKVWPSCVQDILKLVRFVYDNIPSSSGEAEKIRAMLSQYIGYEMENFIHETEFQNLLQENGEFLRDFCLTVEKRIVN